MSRWTTGCSSMPGMASHPMISPLVFRSRAMAGDMAICGLEGQGAAVGAGASVGEGAEESAGASAAGGAVTGAGAAVGSGVAGTGVAAPAAMAGEGDWVS